MNCMKCGRELRDYRVFCEDCQSDMEKYPIKPGTPIQLPLRAEVPAVKKKPGKTRRSLKPEEQLPRLRSSVRLLTLALVVAVIAFLLTTVMMLRLLDERDNHSYVGQNYSVVPQEST